jgi:hypothetical protein
VRQRQIELPSIEALPQETCRQCGRSLIRGLFTPVELEARYPSSPRCRTCIGEINERAKAGRTAQLRNRSADTCEERTEPDQADLPP